MKELQVKVAAKPMGYKVDAIGYIEERKAKDNPKPYVFPANKLFDRIRDAGKGAKEVIDYLGTTTGDFQMDIAETNDELRVKVESLVKMIKR